MITHRSRYGMAALTLTAMLAGALAGQDELVADKGAQPSAPNQKPYVLGTETIPIPSRPLPERGVAFEDPVFGAKITRITDPSDGWGTTMRRHAYATFSPLNCNATMLLLEDGGPWHVYDLK